LSPLDRLWLLGTARFEREALGRTIQYTPPHAWEEQSPADGWRNRDIVAHLAASDVAAAAVISGETPAEVVEFGKTLNGEPQTVEAFNEFSVKRRADEPFRSVVLEWGKGADLFLARVGKVSEEDWSTRKVQWIAGSIGLPYLVQERVTEWWLHGEDILAGGGNPPRLEHAPIFCVNDFAIRLIPYALGQAGKTVRGKTVKVDLHSVGGGSWHCGLASRESPPPDKVPDALIGGQGYAFALVAGRRIPAEYYLADGTLLTGGDDALAEMVLQHLRAFTG
jgi:enediyne biosynthesis protein E11